MIFVGGVQAGGDAANGKVLSEYCVDCHGDDGMGDEDIPKIAGMDAADHVKALSDFKSGARPDEEENMIDSVADLSEQDIADLAAYFASLPGK
jgi:cytochrome c553